MAAKCEAALELIRVHAPRQFGRLNRYSDGILVLGDAGPLGAWMRSARLIRLGQHFILRADTQPAHVAGTIIHETTHAWLEHLGFRYSPGRRQRIEAICYRSEAAFARQLSGGDALASYYEACAQTVLQQGDDEWSDRAFRTHAIRELRELGTPDWLVDAVARVATMLYNER